MYLGTGFLLFSLTSQCIVTLCLNKSSVKPNEIRIKGAACMSPMSSHVFLMVHSLFCTCFTLECSNSVGFSGRLTSALPKFQALVYDILPSTTAVFSYLATPSGPENCQLTSRVFVFLFFFWCSNRSKFVTNNSDYIRRLFYDWPCCLRQLR